MSHVTPYKCWCAVFMDEQFLHALSLHLPGVCRMLFAHLCLCLCSCVYAVIYLCTCACLWGRSTKPSASLIFPGGEIRQPVPQGGPRAWDWGWRRWWGVHSLAMFTCWEFNRGFKEDDSQFWLSYAALTPVWPPSCLSWPARTKENTKNKHKYRWAERHANTHAHWSPVTCK